MSSEPRDDEIDRLEQRLDGKFQEIVALLADQLGLPNASAEDRERLAEEAEHCIDRWEEDAEMGDRAPTVSMPLQRLLSEHHDIAEAILDLRDAELDEEGKDDSLGG